MRSTKSLGQHLEKIKKVSLDGNKVKLYFGSEFEIVLIQQEGKAVNDCVTAVLGPSAQAVYLVEEEKPREDTVTTEFANKVELFKRVFRGDIME